MINGKSATRKGKTQITGANGRVTPAGVLQPAKGGKRGKASAPAQPERKQAALGEAHPGVYRRKTATGYSYHLRVRIGGVDRYRALDLPSNPKSWEIDRAAAEAREALENPAQGIDTAIDAYAVAKELRPHSITAFRQALRGFCTDDDAQNAAAVVAIKTNPRSSDGTKSAYMQRISSFFRWLIETGARVKNPCTGHKIPSKPAPRDCTFDSADVDRLLETIDKGGTLDDRLFARLLRYTGARCSTIAAITPSDVASDGSGYRLTLQNVKCGRAYSVPLLVTDPATCELLRRKMARVKRNFWGTGERVLHDRLARAMRRVIGDGATPHGLRHFRACELLAKGVPLETISRILDHKSIAITHEVYAKQSQQAIDQAMEL